MPFVKGQSGNPDGRPKKPEIEELRKAIKVVEKTKRKKLLRHFVERAYTNDKVLVALMKKILADVKFEERNLNIGGQEGNPIGLIMFSGLRKNDTDTKRKVHRRPSRKAGRGTKRV